MNDDTPSLSSAEFGALFPFHLAFDRDLRLLSVGTSLARLLGSRKLELLTDAITISRPRAATDFDSIASNLSQLFILSVPRESGVELKLRGQMRLLEDGMRMIFVGSPWLESASKLKQSGLRLQDFALHDPTGDLIHLMQTHLAAFDDARNLAEQLGTANQRLKEQYAAVERAEARIRTIVSAAVDAIITTDEHGVVQSFNRAAERMFQYGADDVIGRNVSMLMPSPFREEHDSYMARYNATHEPRIIGIGREVPAATKNGTEFWCELAVSETEADGGVQFVGILRDISDRKAAERAVNETTVRLSTLIRNLDAGVLLEDESRSVVLVNQKFCDMFGLDSAPELLVGTDAARLCHQVARSFEDPDGFTRGAATLHGTQEPRVDEILHLADNRIASRDFVPVIVDQQHRGNLWLYDDVTDKMKAQEAIRQSERRFRQTLSAAQAGAWEWDFAHSKGFWSEENYRLLGYEPGTVEPSLETFLVRVHPEDRDTIHAAFHRVVELRAPFQYDYRIVRPDGTIRWLRDTGNVETDDSGNVVRVSAIVTDITEGKNSRMQLAETTSRLAALIQNLSAGLVVEDENRRVQLANWEFCRMFRIERAPDALVGTDGAALSECIASLYEHPEQFAERIDECITTWTHRHRTESQLVDGRILEWDYIPIVVGDSYRGHMWQYRDITAQKSSERAMAAAKELAERANAAKTNFLATMSHEIRTPLNAILGMSELMCGSDLTREQSSYLGTISSSAEALLALVNDFLDLSKIEAGEFDLGSAPFSPRQLVDEVQNILLGRAALKGVAVRTAVDDRIPVQLIGDAVRLRQVLLNLGGNAVKFTDTGEVDLAVEAVHEGDDATTVRFIVRDTGIGIPREQQARIFDRFYQADQSVTRKYRGTGLGLDICKALLGKMGGNVWLEWSEPGKGSEFRMQLELRHAPVMAQTPLPAASASRKPTGASDNRRSPIRILFAEDNSENREIAERMLTAEGYSVECVEDGAAAVARYDPALHDLILMDVEMPGMDGVTATAAIRKREVAEGVTPVPIVMLSAHVLQEIRERSIAAGANDFVPKPARKADLVAAIERWRDLRSAVLVVDDSRFNREYVTRLLVKDGTYRAYGAENGADALALLDRWHFAAVLLDLEMEGVDGFQTAAAVRSRFGREIPLIALSGHDDAKTAERCLASGFDRYLVKPARPQVVMQVLREVIPAASTQHEPELSEITLENDPKFKALVGRYVTKRHADAIRLASLLDSGDFDPIRVIGHNLKGTAGAYGFPELGPIGAALEIAAEARDASAVREHIAALNTFLENVFVKR